MRRSLKSWALSCDSASAPPTATCYFTLKTTRDPLTGDRGLVLSRRSFQQQCHGDMAAFVSKNVVGAAGGLGVHGFNAGLFVN